MPNRVTLNDHDLAVYDNVRAYEQALALKCAAEVTNEVAAMEHVASGLAAVMSKRQAWLGACAWDGVDPNSPFVVFTEDNPYAARYDALMS